MTTSSDVAGRRFAHIGMRRCSCCYLPVKIIHAEFESNESRDLLVLLDSEWGDYTSIEPSRHGLALPKPLIAVKEDRVIGGAAFTAFIAPDGGDVVIWLNALFVKPEYRGMGIASKIVMAAREGSPKLYALTAVPGLYTKLGWKVWGDGVDGTVVHT